MPLVLGFIALLAALVVAQATPSPPSGASSPASQTAAPMAPAASATPAYHFVYRPTPSPATTPFPGPNAPEIDEIDLNDATITTPGDLHVRVLTSDAVVSVTAETFGRSVAIPQRQRGVFALDSYIPTVPEFLRNRTYAVQFVAGGADGRTASISLPLTLK